MIHVMARRIAQLCVSLALLAQVALGALPTSEFCLICPADQPRPVQRQADCCCCSGKDAPMKEAPRCACGMSHGAPAAPGSGCGDCVRVRCPDHDSIVDSSAHVEVGKLLALALLDGPVSLGLPGCAVFPRGARFAQERAPPHLANLRTTCLIV